MSAISYPKSRTGCNSPTFLYFVMRYFYTHSAAISIATRALFIQMAKGTVFEPRPPSRLVRSLRSSLHKQLSLKFVWQLSGQRVTLNYLHVGEPRCKPVRYYCCKCLSLSRVNAKSSRSLIVITFLIILFTLISLQLPPND